MPTPYDTDLDRNAANFQPLTPLSFLARAAAVAWVCPSLRESIYRLTWRSVTRLPDIQCSPAIAGNIDHLSRSEAQPAIVVVVKRSP